MKLVNCLMRSLSASSSIVLLAVLGCATSQPIASAPHSPKSSPQEELTALRAEYERCADPKDRVTQSERLVPLLLGTSLVSEAQRVCLETLATDPARGRTQFEQICTTLRAADNQHALLAWTGQVLVSDPPLEMLPAIYQQRFTAWQAAGQLHGCLDELPATLQVLAPGDVLSLLLHMSTTLQANDELDELARLDAAIELLAQDSETVREAQFMLRQNRLLAAGKYDEAAAELFAGGAGLSGANFAAACTPLVDPARPELAEKVGHFVFNKVHGRNAAKTAIAHNWVLLARNAANPSNVVARVEKINSLPIPFAIQNAAATENFYYIMKVGTAEQQQKMREVVTRLRPNAKSVEDQSSLVLMMLDGAYMAKDYVTMKALAEAGVPGQTADWREHSLLKINAHIAMSEGRNEEAIELFQHFLEHMPLDSDSLLDPLSEEEVPVDSVHALNQKRIADLYTALGRNEEAAAAYAKSRSLYEQALSKVQPDSVIAQEINKAVATLPK